MVKLLLKRGFQHKKIVRFFSSIRRPSLPPYDYTPRKYTESSKEVIINNAKEYLSDRCVVSQNPLIMVDQKMQYIYDLSGKRYLNASEGICGSGHPALDENFMQLYTCINEKYLKKLVTQFEEALSSKLPRNLKIVGYTNTAADANQLAVFMAHLHSGNVGVVTLRDTCLDIWKDISPKGVILEVVNPDPYRGDFGSDAASYVKNLDETIFFQKFGCVAGFMAEAIQGVGAIELVPGYLKLAYDVIRKAGGICIANEVNTGFGRTGSHYWGFEAHDVCPDIITIDEGFESGYPLGVVVGTPEMKNIVAQIQSHTHKIHPNRIAGGLVLLEILEKEKLQEHCLQVGVHLVERLVALQQRHDLIGNVRGRGLMVGVELVTDREKKTPAKAETVVLSEKLEEIGVLIDRGGVYGNVLKIKPPFCFNRKDADFLVDALDYALSKM